MIKMDRETLKEKCNLDNIIEVEMEIAPLEIVKYDYVIDDKGNKILHVNVIEMKLLERIKNLENRIIELEKIQK